MKNKVAVIAGISAFVLSLIPAGDSFYKSHLHYKNSKKFEKMYDPKDSYTIEYSLEASFERQRGKNELITGYVLTGCAFPIGWLTYLLFKKEEDDEKGDDDKKSEDDFNIV